MDSLTNGPFRFNPPGPKPEREFFAYFLEGRLVSHVGFNFANAPPAVAPAINGQGVTADIQRATTNVAGSHLANSM